MSSTRQADDVERTSATVSGPDATSTSSPRHRGEPLSILRLATDLYPEITGGGAIHAHAMSKRQAAQGHDVTVLTSDHGDRSQARVEQRDGYTVVRNSQVARPFGNSITPGTVASLHKRLPEADVVHAHSHLYFSSNVAAAVARVADAPLVVTNHGLVSQTAPEWLQRLFLPTVGRFTFDAAACVLCYSETDEQRLRDRGVDAPIRVVNNGIDCQQFTPGRDREGSGLLFVGRLTDAKGLPTLLEAVARLESDYPDLTLDVVGDGPERSRYERRCRQLGIADRVTFVGDVPYDEMVRYYREAAAFVLPSHCEGLPRTVLEAMACETPVVASAVGGIPEIVVPDETGLLVDVDPRGGEDVEPAEPEAFARRLAEGVNALMGDPERRREMGAAARRRVEEQFSWRSIAEQTLDFYKSLI